jgi:NagD protein
MVSYPLRYRNCALQAIATRSGGHFVYIKTGLFVALVLGETVSYNFVCLSTALCLVAAGAQFIATNLSSLAPQSREWSWPALRSNCGHNRYRNGSAALLPWQAEPPRDAFGFGCLRGPLEDTVMISDCMDTNIVTGTESGLETVLVLTGVTSREEVERFLYRPTHIVEFVATRQPYACNIERR